MGKLILKNVRFSYVNVFEPRKNDRDKMEYSVCILLPKSDKALIRQVQAEIDALSKDALETKFKGKTKLPSTFKIPLHDGDEEKEGNATFAGMMYLNARSSMKPDVIDRAKKPITPESGDFYSGAWGAVSITLYIFDTEGAKGIGVGLNNILKTKDDTKFAGGSSAAEDFADIELDDDDDLFN